jgi:hypothetical protein
MGIKQAVENDLKKVEGSVKSAAKRIAGKGRKKNGKKKSPAPATPTKE